jgi:hypothetical protein
MHLNRAGEPVKPRWAKRRFWRDVPADGRKIACREGLLVLDCALLDYLPSYAASFRRGAALFFCPCHGRPIWLMIGRDIGYRFGNGGKA